VYYTKKYNEWQNAERSRLEAKMKRG
jgi:hypothetical protein